MQMIEINEERREVRIYMRYLPALLFCVVIFAFIVFYGAFLSAMMSAEAAVLLLTFTSVAGSVLVMGGLLGFLWRKKPGWILFLFAGVILILTPPIAVWMVDRVQENTPTPRSGTTVVYEHESFQPPHPPG